MTAKILVLQASSRPQSPAARLAAAAALQLARDGADVTRVSLQDYPLPIFDEMPDAVPRHAVTLSHLIGAHDGVAIAAPEINASLAPLVKNAVDWTEAAGDDSRGSPWRGRFVALAQTCEAPHGGEIALAHLRSVMVGLGSEVIGGHCLVRDASKAFDGDGEIVDEAARGALAAMSRSLVRYCRALAPEAGERWEKAR